MKKLTTTGKTLRAIVALIAIFWLTQLPPFGGIEGGFCQDNVGIGTDDPDPNAILDLYAIDKGLLIPRLTNVQRTGLTLAGGQTGLLVYDTDDDQFWYWDGGQWVTIGGGGGGCVTLDEAYDCGGAGVGRIITSDAGAVEINASIASSIALKVSHSNVGTAISAESTSSSNSFSTIQSISNSTQANIAAVLGHSTANAYGVSGQVDASATAEAAVFGNNLRTNGGIGVLGQAYNGVAGETNYKDGYGIWGYNYNALGAGNGIGVCGTGYVGVWGQTTSGGFGVYSIGDLLATGLKFFSIDHPLDPENKFLRHFCIESPEVLNLYRGTVVLDENGQAFVELPDYFESININFSYNLTPIGNSAPNLYIKQEINNAKFQIAGGNPGLKVSWVVYAQRNDLYVQKNPERLNPEPVKKDSEKGKYLMPELYDQPESKSIHQLQSINTSKKEQLNIMK